MILFKWLLDKLSLVMTFSRKAIFLIHCFNRAVVVTLLAGASGACSLFLVATSSGVNVHYTCIGIIIGHELACWSFSLTSQQGIESKNLLQTHTRGKSNKSRKAALCIWDGVDCRLWVSDLAKATTLISSHMFEKKQFVRKCNNDSNGHYFFLQS